MIALAFGPGRDVLMCGAFIIRLSVASCHLPVTSQFPVSSYPLAVTSCCQTTPSMGNWTLGTGDWEPETGYWRLAGTHFLFHRVPAVVSSSRMPRESMSF